MNVARMTVKCDCGREVVLSGYVSKLTLEERRLRRKAFEIVAANPEELTRNELAIQLSARRSTALRVVARLVLDGVMGPDQPRARLSVIAPLPETARPARRGSKAHA